MQVFFALWISQEEEDDYDEDESGASSECESDNNSSKSNGETVSSPSIQTKKPNYTNSSQTNEVSTGWPRTGEKTFRYLIIHFVIDELS